MLYHKGSFNYAVRIMTYMRLRVLVRILSRGGRWAKDRADATSDSLVGLRGNEAPGVWEIHYRNFLKEGWAYLRPNRFVHHCTDGPECPVAHAFSRAEARAMFRRCREVEMKVAHFPLRKTWSWFPLAIEGFLASRLGWYLFIYGRK